jgi:hypothetical protein
VVSAIKLEQALIANSLATVFMRHLSASPSSLNFNSRLIITPIQLVESLPEQFVEPKFQIGQSVFWARVPTRGFGRIIGFVFAQSINVQATGYHYAIAFDDHSSSRADCLADWAFEDDLEQVDLTVHGQTNLEGSDAS